MTDSTPKQENLLTFPCHFPIKVMGLADANLENFVKKTLEKELTEPETLKIESRSSTHQNFISVTATFTATSKKELDSVYKYITANPAVKFVL